MRVGIAGVGFERRCRGATTGAIRHDLEGTDPQVVVPSTLPAVPLGLELPALLAFQGRLPVVIRLFAKIVF